MSRLKDHLLESNLFTNRVVVMTFIITLLSALLLVRLLYLQIHQHHKYQTLSTKNQISMIPKEPRRGQIFDRNGVLIAENIPYYTLEITPQYVKSLDKTLTALKELADVTEDEIEAFLKAIKHRRAFDPIIIKRNLNEIDMATFAVNRHQFPGVEVKVRFYRHYPEGENLAHALGYVGQITESDLSDNTKGNYAASSHIGKSGIEKYYEDALHGITGFDEVETNAAGRVVRTIKKINPSHGKDITLSIDTKLQKITTDALVGTRGAVVVLHIPTGEILAIASAPTFNPNVFATKVSSVALKTITSAQHQPLFNRAIKGQYPPASTLKPFIALAGLEQKLISASYLVNDPGFYKVPGTNYIYRDMLWKLGGRGKVNLRRALATSNDTYFYKLAHMMGIDTMHHMLAQFGFGKQTEIDLPFERNGLLPSKAWKKLHKHEKWYSGDSILVGIGQGFMSATPIQIAKATAILASKGATVNPHLILKTESKDNSNTKKEEALKPATISIKNKTNWDIIHKGLRETITSREGTGRRFGRNPPYSVAAKTGTGQVFSPKLHANMDMDNLPEHLHDHSLFIAFAPFEKPEYAIAVVIEHNNSAPLIAREVMDGAMRLTLKSTKEVKG